MTVTMLTAVAGTARINLPEGSRYATGLAGFGSARADVSAKTARAHAQVGRTAGATGGGNPTKQIRLHLHLPGSLGPHSDELERQLSSPRRYFALLAKHSVYDIERAARELKTDTWTLPHGDVDAGDRSATSHRHSVRESP